MRPYLDLMRHVLDHGHRKSDRTGTGTRSVFGWQMRFDLAEGFPLLTTKKLHLRSIIHELLWFLQGDTNIRYLKENGVSIWDDWADANGDLGPVYGHQWRHWPAGSSAKANRPDRTTDRGPEEQSRFAPAHRFGLEPGRHSADEAAALPCPVPVLCSRRKALLPALSAQCRHLSRRAVQHRFVCAVHADGGAGLRPYQPGDFVWTGGDCHLYSNHIEQTRLQLSREPRPRPTMKLNPAVKDIFGFRYEDFTLEGYDPHPHIAAPVAV
jgi:thymidylate synthase